MSVEYEGARTAKGLADFVGGAFPNLALPVAEGDGSLEKLLQTGAEHLAGAPPAAHGWRALLLSSKAQTPLLTKALALRLRGRMALGEAKTSAPGAEGGGGGAQALAERFGVGSLPALVLLPAKGAEGGEGEDEVAEGAEVYAGEMKFGPLLAFLEARAGPQPEPPAPRAAPGRGRSLGGVARGVDSAFYAAQIARSAEAWVLAFERGSSADGPDDAADPARVPALGRLASQLRGQAVVGLVNASTPGGAELAAQMGVAQFPALRVLRYGVQGKALGAAVLVPDAGAARREAGESLPASAVKLTDEAGLDALLGATLGGEGGALATCVLLSDKESPPPLLRALALRFAGAFAFAMLPASTPATLGRFGLSKLPSLICLFAEGPPGADGQVRMQGAAYDGSAGPLAFEPIGAFLAQLGHKMGGKDWAQRLQQTDDERAEGASGSGGGGGSAGGVAELTAATFEAECGQGGKQSLCAIALLDGDRAQAPSAAREAHLRTLAGLAARRRGDSSAALYWLDATCHDELLAALDVSDAELPTLVVLAPAKRRVAKLRGTFTVEGTARFIAAVVGGRESTLPLPDLPTLDATVDCGSALRGAAKAAALAGEGEDDGADTVAEILAEEEERRRLLQEQLRAEADAKAVEAGGKGGAKGGSGDGEGEGGGELSALQQLEAALEECGMHDLLCSARRDKQLAAIEQRRRLEARLAEIAAQNKDRVRRGLRGAPRRCTRARLALTRARARCAAPRACCASACAEEEEEGEGRQGRGQLRRAPN